LTVWRGVFCSKDGRSVLGLNIVVLAWSNGIVTIPLAIKIWKKDGASKYILALELLSYARNILKIKPKYVTFDSWYSLRKILQRLQKYGWIFYTQIKKNRKFNGAQVQRRHKNPYWMETGTIDSDFKILIVRNGKKYFATNNLAATKQELLAAYKTRWNIKTMFRTLYDQLGMEQCQSQSLTAQNAHIHLCFLAFVVLERARIETNQTNYQKSAVKIHTQLDLKGNIPSFFLITKAKTDNVNFLDHIEFEKDSIYIMDRGYLHFQRLHTIHEGQALFIISPCCYCKKAIENQTRFLRNSANFTSFSI